MSTKQLTPKDQKPSKLNQFTLGFELNKTWAEARKDYAALKNKK